MIYKPGNFGWKLVRTKNASVIANSKFRDWRNRYADRLTAEISKCRMQSQSDRSVPSYNFGVIEGLQKALTMLYLTGASSGKEETLRVGSSEVPEEQRRGTDG